MSTIQGRMKYANARSIRITMTMSNASSNRELNNPNSLDFFFVAVGVREALHSGHVTAFSSTGLPQDWQNGIFRT